MGTTAQRSRTKVEKFITFYCAPRCRDAKRAALKAGYTAKDAPRRLMNNPEIVAEIDRRIAMVTAEVAKLEAKQEVVLAEKEEILTENLLDKTLGKFMDLDPKEHGGNMLRALQLGYVRKGVIKLGNQEAVNQTPLLPTRPTGPPTYRAFETHTVHREIQQPAPEAPAALPAPVQTAPPPQVIEAVPEKDVVWNY